MDNFRGRCLLKESQGSRKKVKEIYLTSKGMVRVRKGGKKVTGNTHIVCKSFSQHPPFIFFAFHFNGHLEKIGKTTKSIVC